MLLRLFFRRGEKMRAARRLVEGTDDVVSDVPPPGTLGGGDARETMVRGRAVECELRHPRGCIYRGGAGAGYRGWASGRIGWKYYYIRETLASLNARVQPTAPDSCGLSPLCHPRSACRPRGSPVRGLLECASGSLANRRAP